MEPDLGNPISNASVQNNCYLHCTTRSNANLPSFTFPHFLHAPNSASQDLGLLQEDSMASITEIALSKQPLDPKAITMQIWCSKSGIKLKFLTMLSKYIRASDDSPEWLHALRMHKNET
jgi:hypothetical protein